MVCVHRGWLVAWAIARPTVAPPPPPTVIHWDQFSSNGLCLSMGEIENNSSIAVSLVDCAGPSHHTFATRDFYDRNHITPFAIYKHDVAPADRFHQFGRQTYEWCLTAHEIDSTSSWFDMRRCDESPQQKFTTSSPFNPSPDENSYAGSILSFNGLCLDGTTSEATNNTLTAHTCGRADQQLWASCRERSVKGDSMGRNGYTTNCENYIQSEASSLCVDLPDGDSTNGALLWMWNCYGGSTQHFDFFGSGVEFLHHRRCLDVLGGDTTNGNLLGLWDCNGGDNQQWGFNPDLGTMYLISDPTKCVQMGENRGDNLMIWDCNGETNQALAMYPGPLGQKQFLI